MLKLQITYQQVYVHIAVTTPHRDEPPLLHNQSFFLRGLCTQTSISVYDAKGYKLPDDGILVLKHVGVGT